VSFTEGSDAVVRLCATCSSQTSQSSVSSHPTGKVRINHS
jgi:hypothetical protein